MVENLNMGIMKERGGWKFNNTKGTDGAASEVKLNTFTHALRYKGEKGVFMQEEVGEEHAIIKGGVTLVSRWEGFPAMFLRIREVSLSR